MPDGQSINYLYICALDKQAASQIEKKACSYMIDKLESGKSDYTIYERARVALILYEADKQAKAKELVRSIKEYTVATDEMARYFDSSNLFLEQFPYSYTGRCNRGHIPYRL